MTKTKLGCLVAFRPGSDHHGKFTEHGTQTTPHYYMINDMMKRKARVKGRESDELKKPSLDMKMYDNFNVR